MERTKYDYDLPEIRSFFCFEMVKGHTCFLKMWLHQDYSFFNRIEDINITITNNKSNSAEKHEH